MKLDELTPDEIKALNAKTEAECLDAIEEKQVVRKIEVSTALSHLLGVVESETIEIKFKGATQDAVLKIKANPSQKMLKELMVISEKSPDIPESDEDKLCEILEYLTVDPIIPFSVWKSGNVPDEIPARIIVELVKFKAGKQAAIEEDISNFRKDKRRTKATGNQRTPTESTE